MDKSNSAIKMYLTIMFVVTYGLGILEAIFQTGIFYNILHIHLQYLSLNGCTNLRTVLPPLFFGFAVGNDHCIHFLLKCFVEKQAAVAGNISLS